MANTQRSTKLGSQHETQREDSTLQRMPEADLRKVSTDLAEALEGLYNAIDSCVALTPEVLAKAREALKRAGRA